MSGDRAAYGIGVYSTPDINVVKGYAERILYSGRKYSVIFMNRIFPAGRVKANNGQYFVTTTASKGQHTDLIRPYAILLVPA